MIDHHRNKLPLFCSLRKKERKYFNICRTISAVGIFVIYGLEQWKGSSVRSTSMQKILIFFAKAAQWFRKPKLSRNASFKTKLLKQFGEQFHFKNAGKPNF